MAIATGSRLDDAEILEITTVTDFYEIVTGNELPFETKIQIQRLESRYPGILDYSESFNIAEFPDYNFQIIGPRAFLRENAEEIGQLRHKTFVDKLKWKIGTVIKRENRYYDVDHYDLTSLHIIVRDNTDDKVISSVRLQLTGESTVSKILSNEEGFTLEENHPLKAFLSDQERVRELVALTSGLMSTTSELNNNYNGVNGSRTVLQQLRESQDPIVIAALDQLKEGRIFEIQRLVVSNRNDMWIRNFALTLSLMSVIADRLGIKYAFGQSDDNYVKRIVGVLGKKAIRIAATTKQYKKQAELDEVHLVVYDTNKIRELLIQLGQGNTLDQLKIMGLEFATNEA